MSEAKIIFSDNGKSQYPTQNEEGLSVSGENGIKMEHFIIKILIHQKLQFIIII